jgi:hypothetical protein
MEASKLNKSKRELKIDQFVNQLGTQEEWEYDMNKKIKKLYEKYSEELEDYIFIKNKKEYNQISNGGYVRYFNLNNELRWGGILLRKDKNKEIDIMILCNSSYKRFIVSFDKNIIFYKKHTTQADKTRKLFLSYLQT